MVKTISISGVDGAGKSTQASLLYAYLRRKGYGVRYLWLRWFALLTYPLYLYAKITRRTITLRKGRYTLKIHLFWLDPALRKLYPYTIMLDIYAMYVLNKVLTKLEGIRIAILDRSLIDAVVDVIWETRSTKFLRSFVSRLLAKVLNESTTIILTASVKTIIRRKNDVVSIKELEFKKKCFEILAKQFNLPIIDTSRRSIVETFREIMRCMAASQLHV